MRSVLSAHKPNWALRRVTRRGVAGDVEGEELVEEGTLGDRRLVLRVPARAGLGDWLLKLCRVTRAGVTGKLRRAVLRDLPEMPEGEGPSISEAVAAAAALAA